MIPADSQHFKKHERYFADGKTQSTRKLRHTSSLIVVDNHAENLERNCETQQ